jgi:hypothetical protein
MAVSDPTMSVPTPTGILQGVAAFNWDGAVWQPAGRAGPSVPTPTGNLQGVAAFSGVPPQPTGRAGSGVATPTGVLDGVAVYTWSGSQWTPPGGQPTPSTPSGALRGVAAFDWDGAAWQPAGQAGPDVATPYGVLQGVARFGWTGSAWAAVGAPSLSLDFMTPGTLDSRIIFTRASTATYTDASGTIQTAAVNAPRWDYAGGVPRGLLIEESRGNVVRNSGDASNATWSKGNIGVAAPVVTGNQILAPDGTMSGARVVYPAVSGAGNASNLGLDSGSGASVAPYTLSIWARGSVGGEQVYLNLTPNGSLFYRLLMTLTTTWQRYVLTTPNLTATTWFPSIGTDLRDAGQSGTPAQTIYVWGAQIEQGASATSYIPTTSAAVTRALDVCQMPLGAWFNVNTYSLAFEFIASDVSKVFGGISDAAFSANTSYFTNSQYVCGGTVTGSPALTNGSVSKQCAASTAGGNVKLSNNGGIPATVSGALTQSGATRLAIGNDPWSLSSGACAWFRRVVAWPRVLSDAEMRQVTT